MAQAAALLRNAAQGGALSSSEQLPLPSSSSSFNGMPCVPRKSGFGKRPQGMRQRQQTPRAAGFDLWQLLGGRGLETGEVGLKTEKGQAKLFKDEPKEKPETPKERMDDLEEEIDGFNKELGGMVGGFPGGEKGVKGFVQKYPPPKKIADYGEAFVGKPGLAKAQSMRPPLLMPGMTVICKKPDSVYHMYSGIVQRVTDGRVGVILEGGNWDKLVTFELRDLERTTAGPPGTNPKSKILEKEEPAVKKADSTGSKAPASASS